jgi:predicted transposase/invertase (TIGR01784 family)
VWIRRVLLPNRAPGMELPEFNDLQDLHEVHDMLAERIKKWPEQWEERGIQKGRMEGRMEGRQEAKRETARNLISMNILTDAQIAQASGLSEAEVQALRSETTH